MPNTAIFVGSFKPPHKGHFQILKKMLKYCDDVRIIISKKKRQPCSSLTGEKSKEIWKIYLNLLPLKDRNRVRLMLSHLPSPTMTAYGYIKNVARPGDTFYLVKSMKNASNRRYASIENMKKKGVHFVEVAVPAYDDLHSTDMRRCIHTSKTASSIAKFIPPGLRDKDKKAVVDIIIKGCSH